MRFPPATRLRSGEHELIFGFIHAEKATFPIAFMCAELGVSRNGYYKWRNRLDAPPGPRAAANAVILAEIVEIFTKSRGRYGAPRVHAALRKTGRELSRNRVARLMAEHGLVGRPGRSRATPRTTINNPDATASPNIVNRDFTPEAPDRVWVTDVTYLRTSQGFLFLAAIIDCYSRLVVGWSVADHLRTSLCTDALNDALRRRRIRPGLIHHSDRGCQYTSHTYREHLAAAQIVQSMSRVGNCWDNAVAESFFSTLKQEFVYTKDWATHAELELGLFEYIEVFYNRERIHSTIDYSTPFEYDQAFNNTLAATQS